MFTCSSVFCARGLFQLGICKAQLLGSAPSHPLKLPWESLWEHCAGTASTLWHLLSCLSDSLSCLGPYSFFSLEEIGGTSELTFGSSWVPKREAGCFVLKVPMLEWMQGGKEGGWERLEWTTKGEWNCWLMPKTRIHKSEQCTFKYKWFIGYQSTENRQKSSGRKFWEQSIRH